MRQVRRDVLTETQRQQVPWNHSSLTGSFMFNRGLAGSTTTQESARKANAPDVQSQSSISAAYSATEKIASCTAYKAFEENYSDSFYARLARAWQLKNCADQNRSTTKKTKIASLQDDGEPQSIDMPDMRKLTLALQSELKRVGCNPGKLDGSWGSKGRGALVRFNKYAKLSLPSDKPSQATLDAIKT